MHFFTTCTLLLLTSGFTSIATQQEENTCREAKTSHADHDQSVLIQHELLVQRHDHEQVDDKQKKIIEEPIRAQPALLQKELEAQHNQSDKKSHGKVTSVKLLSELQVAAHVKADELKNSANSSRNLTSQIKDLGKTYDDVMAGAEAFTSDGKTCVDAMHESDMPVVKAVEKAFECFDKSVVELARVVKVSSKSTVEFLQSLVPKDSEVLLVDEETTVMKAADDLAEISKEITEDVIGVNASMICAVVTKAYEYLEQKSVAFIQEIPNLNPLAAEDKYHDLKKQIKSIRENNMTTEESEQTDKAFKKCSEATDAILEKTPLAVTHFKSNIATALMAGTCESTQLEHSGTPKLWPWLLALLASLCWSMLMLQIYGSWGS